jgi:hypothetical protein
MLTLNNAEWLVLNNVVMPTNIWGGWYNVRKDLDQEAYASMAKAVNSPGPSMRTIPMGASVGRRKFL